MKIINSLMTIGLIVLSCSKEETSLKPAELDNPVAVNICCQSSPDDTLKQILYEYEGDRLIAERTLSNGTLQSKTTYEYDSEKKLALEVYETDWQKTEKTYVYNELDQIINILYKFISYDSNGQVVDESESEAPREYENNRLVKEWEYWGGFITYEYKDENVVIKIEYTKSGEKHHITTYKYSGDLLVEEKKETKVSTLIYLKTYIYDAQNRLIAIQDGENIIEENDYIDNKLIERREYYFGIDPCFAACCGNYIYRFEY